MDRSTATEPSYHDEIESTPFLAPDPLSDETAAAESSEDPQISQPKTRPPPIWALVSSAIFGTLAISYFAFSTVVFIMPEFGRNLGSTLGVIRTMGMVAFALAIMNHCITRRYTRKRSLPLRLRDNRANNSTMEGQLLGDIA